MGSHRQIVKVRKGQKAETLYLVYEPERYDENEDELSTNTNSEVG